MSDLVSRLNAQTNGNPVPPVSAATSAARGLGQADFLRLMTTQVAAQDPFDPLDQTQMLGQLAQFSQVAGAAEMNASLAALLEQVRSQNALLADIRERLGATPASAASTPTPPTAGA